MVQLRTIAVCLAVAGGAALAAGCLERSAGESGDGGVDGGSGADDGPCGAISDDEFDGLDCEMMCDFTFSPDQWDGLMWCVVEEIEEWGCPVDACGIPANAESCAECMAASNLTNWMCSYGYYQCVN